jgi:hypothetical protein
MSALWNPIQREAERPKRKHPARPARLSAALRFVISFVAVIALLLLAVGLPEAPASPRHGYSFDGGTPRERDTVVAALAASAFDWSVIPRTVTVHVVRGRCRAAKGEVWLDPAVLAYGRPSWGIVQHEFAHQVDFFLFTARTRRKLNVLLGGKEWWAGDGRFRHSQYGAERFASTLSGAYWPSPDNVLLRSARAEAAAMAPARFRHLMSVLTAVR